MEAVNVQSSHIAQVVSVFMSAASPINVVATFRSAGITLALGEDGKLYCRVSPHEARCLLSPPEPVVTKKATEVVETRLYLEHCMDMVGDAARSGPE
jgi:hypothetical protein